MYIISLSANEATSLLVDSVTIGYEFYAFTAIINGFKYSIWC